MPGKAPGFGNSSRAPKHRRSFRRLGVQELRGLGALAGAFRSSRDLRFSMSLGTSDLGD